ncbi:MAG: energy-coupled thiamine transporter ThiT, partial [Clostridia bacterium]|nr:energy-coupled thiamine transporter ThiT [Clostridia bacterium]
LCPVSAHRPGGAAAAHLLLRSGIFLPACPVGDSVELFGMSFGGESAYLYSLVYNGSYMLGEMIFCLVASLILMWPLSRLPKKF